MWAILTKELKGFLSSLVGYSAILVFLSLTGFLIWIVPDFSILEYGFATLDPFFSWAPIFMILMISAITMRSFAEEFNLGMYEILSTKPLTINQIIGGKYLAALLILLLALIPTLLYYVTIYILASPMGGVDTAGIIGSYIGLFLLGAVFVSIGLFCSALATNQIVALLFSAALCFFMYLGFDLLAGIELFFGSIDYYIERIGANAHYLSLSRGVIDTRDVLYFITVATLFLLSTKWVLLRKDD